MPMSVGAVALDLKVNGQDYQKQITRITNKADKNMQSVASNMESSFSRSFSRIGKMAVAAFSVAQIGMLIKSCLDLGSALTEVQNVVDVSFPTMSSKINDFAKNAITTFGLSETLAKRFAGTFGSMANAFGFAEGEAAEMAMTLTGLAGDVASFYNMNADEAYTKLKSVFSGETETLKDLGIVMTQTALDAYAMANGFGKTTKSMSEQEKVMLRYQFVQDQLKNATGDFVRTQDSWANQIRVLQLRWESFKASMGKAFIAVFTPIIKGLNWVLANLQVLADSFASMMEFLTGTKIDVSGGSLAEATDSIDGATDSADNLGDGLGGAGDSATAAAKKINKAFAGIDTINKLSFDTGDSGSSGGSSGGGNTSGTVADAVDFPGAEKEATAFSGILDGVLKEFKRLSDIFKTGFTIGFGDSFKNIDRIKEYILSIKDSLIDIFTDPAVTTASRYWIDSIYMNLGKVVGSFASIGVTIATLITGSIATYLDSNKQFIKDKLISLFDISGSINDIIGNFSVVLADIFSVFAGDRAISIGSNLIQTIVNGALNSAHLFLLVVEEIFKNITEPITAHKEGIKTAINEMLGPIEEFTGKIAKAFTDFPTFIGLVGTLAGVITGVKLASLLSGVATSFGLISSSIANFGLVSVLKGLFATTFPGLAGAITALLSPMTLVVVGIAAFAGAFGYLYATSEDFRNKINEVFSNIFSHIGGIIQGLIKIVKTIFDKGIKPVFNSIKNAVSDLWNNGLSSFVENVSMFIANTINLLLSIWDNAINPLINMLLTIFLPIFTTIFDGILAIAVPIVSKILEYFNIFMEVLNIVITILAENVFPIFKTVFDGIAEIFNAFWSVAEPIFKWFMDLLGSVISFVLDFFLAPLDIAIGLVMEIIKSISEPIADVFDGVKKIFQGVIDFVVGIFTGDWSKAWEGVKKIFSGIWDTLKGIVSGVWDSILGLFSKGGEIFSGVVDGIASAFKTIVNAIIDGMNKVIAFPFDKANGVLNTVRTIDIPLIGQPFKGLWKKNPLPVPQIPKLALGGFVKANTPQLAMIGDNRHEGEVVAPESKLLELANRAIQGAKGNGDMSLLTEVIKLLKLLIEAVKGLTLKVDIDMKKLSILLEQAEKERQLIGG